MSRICIDFLAESFLFDTNNIKNFFRDYSDETIDAEITRYRQYIIEKAHDLSAFVFFKGNNTISFDSFSQMVPINTLKSVLLLADTVYLNDPLFALSEKHSEVTIAFAKATGQDISYKIQRNQLCDVLNYMKALQPAIGMDSIIFLPLSYFHEQKDDLDDWQKYHFEFPEKVLQYIHSQSYVCATIEQDGQLVPMRHRRPNKKSPLYVSFDGFEDGMFVRPMFFDKRFNPPLPVQRRTYTDHELINAVQEYPILCACHIIHELLQELSIIDELHATYITNSPFLTKLLNLCTSDNDVEHEVATMVKEITLPCLDSVELTDFLKIRKQAGTSYAAFQKSLRDDLRNVFITCEEDQRPSSIERLSHTIANFDSHNAANELSNERIIAIKDFGVSFINCAINTVTAETTLGRLISLFEGVSGGKRALRNLKENKYYFLSLLSQK